MPVKDLESLVYRKLSDVLSVSVGLERQPSLGIRASGNLVLPPRVCRALGMTANHITKKEPRKSSRSLSKAATLASPMRLALSRAATPPSSIH